MFLTAFRSNVLGLILNCSQIVNPERVTKFGALASILRNKLYTLQIRSDCHPARYAKSLILELKSSVGIQIIHDRQLLDDVEQNIVICWWRADQLQFSLR